MRNTKTHFIFTVSDLSYQYFFFLVLIIIVIGYFVGAIKCFVLGDVVMHYRLVDCGPLTDSPLFSMFLLDGYAWNEKRKGEECK